MTKQIGVLSIALCLSAGSAIADTTADYSYNPVSFTAVNIKGGFWQPRMDTNRAVTIPYCFEKCEQTHRIANFEIAGGLKEGIFRGIRFNDSDVFKVMEGAAYSLMVHPDSKLDRYLEDLIAKVAAAQEGDGYLFTTRTIDPNKPAKSSGKTRWSYLAHSHELYNVGHMYEAAVAHYRATGRKTFLNIATQNADLIDKVFGPDKICDVPGHQEIEIGLCSLYRVTGEKRYLDLAKFFLDMRGRSDKRKRLYGKYSQDHVPAIKQTEAVGHAVRACYMYASMADVAALAGDKDYIKAIDRIWEDVVSKKIYITAGVGALRHGEAFGGPYHLPNAAYNETCAAIANAMWNHRMFLLHGDAKYMDIVELAIYNGFLSGISMKGDTFFYPNPLVADGKGKFNQGAPGRKGWFNCSCCPVNVARFLPSLPGYAYATKKNALYVNLFMSGTTDVEMDNTPVHITQKTEYPWNGKIELSVDPKEKKAFRLCIRIPGWTRGQPIPSDLYSTSTALGESTPTLSVNGKSKALEMENGFAVINRTWMKGDVVELDLPMPILRMKAHEAVKADAEKVALMRGPIVYCAESIDNNDQAYEISLPGNITLSADHRKGLLGGVTVITGKLPAGDVFTAIPYYSWNHRGTTKMSVWLRQ